MSSLRDHFERVRAEKAARQANADPRLSARGRQLSRPLGNTMTRQTAPVQDAEYTDDDETQTLVVLSNSSFLMTGSRYKASNRRLKRTN